MTRVELRDMLRRFWASPNGQHSHADFVIYWEYRSDPSLDDMTYIFTARRVPLLLRGMLPPPEPDIDYIIDRMMREKSLIEMTEADHE